MSNLSLEQLRRDAKSLKKAWDSGALHARQRLTNYPPRAALDDLKHADFLHVIAREAGFASWPALVAAAERVGLDKAQRIQRLKVALYNRQRDVIAELLDETPDLADGDFALSVALYDVAAVRDMLAEDAGRAVETFGLARPIVHLAFSTYFAIRPELEPAMLDMAELLLAHGADVNDSRPVSPDNDQPLSALYGAIGHAGNMVLGRWLLEHGADPNDGESLYHATELGHHAGLEMLLARGADPKGTNALLRAMDFEDVTAVRLLLAHGADPDDFNPGPFGGEAPWVVPALHQAARRMSGREMIDLLLDHGADPERVYEGAGTYAAARVYGNTDLSDALEARGQSQPLSRDEALLARAAEGAASPDEYIDPAQLAPAFRHILSHILHHPGKLAHVKALVAIGVEYDLPNSEGLTPVQLAGWEGLSEVMDYFLRLKPDLGHVNGYGGALLSTIVHGSENNPKQADGDYLGCLELALKEGVALPRHQLRNSGRSDVAAFLKDWAERYPGQVV